MDKFSCFCLRIKHHNTKLKKNKTSTTKHRFKCQIVKINFQMGFDDVLVRSQFERVDVQFRCSYKKLLSKMNTAQDAWNNDMNTQWCKDHIWRKAQHMSTNTTGCQHGGGGWWMMWETIKSQRKRWIQVIVATGGYFFGVFLHTRKMLPQYNHSNDRGKNRHSYLGLGLPLLGIHSVKS